MSGGRTHVGMTTFDESLHPRDKSGRFQRKPDAPSGTLTDSGTGTLSPKQLGIMGLGPDTPNRFAEPFDTERGERPLRPYVALTPADDDEFFDAPAGSILSIAEPTSLTRYVKTDSAYGWEKLSDRNTRSGAIEAGELWGRLFREDGTMRESMLSAPHGTLFSDQHYFVPAATVDQPITAADAIKRLSGGRARLVSRSVFGDSRSDGIPPVFQGTLTVSCTADGYLQYRSTGGQRGASRGVQLGGAELFDRGGDIVIRKEELAGYGWEEVLRVSG